MHSNAEMGNGNDHPRAAIVLIVALYLTTIIVPRILGSGQNPRLKLMIEAGLFVLVLSSITFLIVDRGWFFLDRVYWYIYVLFLLFNALSVIAVANGISRGYPLMYILGDYYKFAIPLFAVLLLYAVVNSSHEFESALAIIHNGYTILLFGILGIYLVGILDPNQRLELLYHLPLVLILAGWLRSRGYYVARITFPLLILAVLPVLYFAQSLSLVIQFVLLGILTPLLYHTSSTVSLFKWGTIVAVGTSIVFLSFVLVGSQVPVQQWERFGYLGTKISYIYGNFTIYERLILLGGSRAAEPIGIFLEINDSLFELILGAGMGSTFVVSSPIGTPVWTGEDHFVHAGLWEAVLRTGLLGGIVYLGILTSFLYVTLKIRGDSYLGALVATYASIQVVSAPLKGKILGTSFFAYLIFAYALVRWTEIRSDEKKTKPKKSSSTW